MLNFVQVLSVFSAVVYMAEGLKLEQELEVPVQVYSFEMGNIDPIIVRKGEATMIDLHLNFLMLPEDLEHMTPVDLQKGEGLDNADV